ncbi:bifunctional folylpolyglutamate synthase/dihydrofolate synthase [Carboxylicivirga sp. N1Y90]|uniref:bifunctional folylpolyglutamate synthase/dihydrofolate synthase n=1 Tax=Carboxylicivirga fragile TaxID=3417571 RepID=UPI003D33B927|nr:bifunctional folylpolyglutamate synthase/dihydrofolate synthase [Marinilabiliaceae bacterium N1Y90]
MKGYKETLDFLFGQLPMYQRVGKAAYKADLFTTQELDRYFRHPHTSYKTIHVAGTNGKGSVSHCLASVLQKAGYKVGLYTSPHLKDFRERIRVDGQMITEEAVVGFVNDHQSIIEELEPSFFEMSVAMALQYFKEEKVDVAVVEVGMGGRLDSTNIIQPELSIITNIGLDHTGFLGTDITSIAGEKAGIIKSEIPVVIGETHPESKEVFEAIAKEKGANLYFADKVYEIPYATNSIDNRQVFQVYENGEVVYENLKLDLLGIYQQKNVVTVLSAINLLNEGGFAISKKHLYEGLNNVVGSTGLLGRWQILDNNPLIVCDTGHNAEGVKQIVDQLKLTPHKQLHIVIGMVDDKDHAAVMSLLPDGAKYYFTKAAIPRSMKPDKLAIMAKEYGLMGDIYLNPLEALGAARKNAGFNDLIFIGGSTFIVADVLENCN